MSYAHRPRGDRRATCTRAPGRPPQLFPEAAAGFDPALDEEYAYDPDKAKQLLAEAGYPDGFEFNITCSGQPDEDQVAIQSQWQRSASR